MSRRQVNSKAVRRVGQRVRKRLKKQFLSCQDCGAGSRLVAHHVVPVQTLVAQERGLREEDHVLRFLCVRCHLEAHGLRQDPTDESAASAMVNLYLGVELVRALRLMAETHGVSSAAVARILITFALEHGGLDEVGERQGREVATADLPKSLINPPEDHWLFRGRKPIPVITGRTFSPLEYVPLSPEDARQPPDSNQ